MILDFLIDRTQAFLHIAFFAQQEQNASDGFDDFAVEYGRGVDETWSWEGANIAQQQDASRILYSQRYQTDMFHVGLRRRCWQRRCRWDRHWKATKITRWFVSSMKSLSQQSISQVFWTYSSRKFDLFDFDALSKERPYSVSLSFQN